MGLNAVKAVSIGEGFNVCSMRGSENNDEMTSDGFATNHAGGILGGITTGAPIVADIAVKPTPSIRKTQMTRDIHGNLVEVSTTGRMIRASAFARPPSLKRSRPSPRRISCC